MDVFEEEMVLVPSSQRREPSPTFDESEDDEEEDGGSPVQLQSSSQRAASPTFDESDASDDSDENDRGDESGARSVRTTQGSRAASPTFDSDEDDGPAECVQLPRETPQQQAGGVATLFQTGAGRSVQLSAASVERGRQLMALDKDTPGRRAQPAAGGSSQGLDSGDVDGGLRLTQRFAQPSQGAATRGTAVKRPASPSFDDDVSLQSDPTAELFARHASAPRHWPAVPPATRDGSAQRVRRLPAAVSVPGRAVSGAGVVAPTPAGKPPTKQRRRTRVLESNGRVQHPPPRVQFLSRRLQQSVQVVSLSDLYVSCARQREESDVPAWSASRSDAECARIVRNCGRGTSFFGNTARDLLLDLVRTGADPKLVDESWILNHSRWIMWKLAAYALHLPVLKAHVPDAPCGFNVSSLREQLRYRYDVEKGLGKRSVLRKIADGDAGPSRPMVLCVVSLLAPAKDGETGARLEVTDGWWPAIALLDDTLTMRCTAGQIKPGDKLWVVGAQPPAKESKTALKPTTGELNLRLHANGTRKAHRHSRMGWQRMSPRSFALPIRSLQPDGGTVCCMDVVVQRVYQTLFREQTKRGTVVFRNSEAEALASKQYQVTLDSRREEISAKVMRKHQNTSSNKGTGFNRGASARGLDTLDDDELYQAVISSNDPDALAHSLSDHQRNSLYKAMEQRRNDIATEIQVALESDEGCAARVVTQLFRMHLSDATVPSSPDFSNSQNTCVVTVWGCHEDTKRVFTEGRRLRLFNVHGANRSSAISSFNFRQDSQVEVVDSAEQPNSGRPVFVPRTSVSFSQLSECGTGAQVDFAGVVLSLSSAATDVARAKGRLFLMDHTKHIVCLQMWQFPNAKQVGTPKDHAARPTLTAVEIRDAFYGGRDSWSGGTHLAYCTEDTAVGFRNLRLSRNQMVGRASSQANSDLHRWLAGPTALLAIETVEGQLSEHLESEQAQFVTSTGPATSTATNLMVIERGTVELTGSLLANRCRADALLTAEALLSAQSAEGRRLTVLSAAASE